VTLRRLRAPLFVLATLALLTTCARGDGGGNNCDAYHLAQVSAPTPPRVGPGRQILLATSPNAPRTLLSVFTWRHMTWRAWKQASVARHVIQRTLNPRS